MIPNWLLGKSKSKLQEILGGGGGGTTYTAGEGIDITNHEISVDPLLMNDIEQTALAIPTKAAKTQITNPNILHNPWFTVNQRGQSSYTSAGYTVDRWKLTSSDMTVNVGDSGIELIHADNNSDASLANILTQNVANALRGKTVTLSVLDANGNIYTNTFTLPEEFPSQQTFYGFLKIPDTGTDYFYIDFMSNILGATKFAIRIGSHVANATISIRAIKLEVGSVSTLAMDPRPEYAIELAKCQRYFQRITQATAGATLCMATYRNSNALRTVLPLAAPMRTDPSATVNGTVGDYTNGGLTMSKAGPAVTNGGAYCIIFNISKSGVTWSDGVSKLISPDSADFYIDFSADL